jgi:hypothetical protein
MVPALAAMRIDDWMKKLDAEAIPVLPRRYQDRIAISDSLPKYIVEPADLSETVEAIIGSLNRETIWAVLTDFGSGEDRQHQPHL